MILAFADVSYFVALAKGLVHDGDQHVEQEYFHDEGGDCKENIERPPKGSVAQHEHAVVGFSYQHVVNKPITFECVSIIHQLFFIFRNVVEWDLVFSKLQEDIGEHQAA